MTYTKKIAAAAFALAAMTVSAGAAFAEDSASVEQRPEREGIMGLFRKAPRKEVMEARQEMRQEARQEIREEKRAENSMIAGKVTAINGTMITIVSPKDSVSYSIDASTAAIAAGLGNNAKARTIADVVVGQTIVVTGSQNGTAVTATRIAVGGTAEAKTKAKEMREEMKDATHGLVTAVSGTTLTMQEREGKTYTVNATTATVVKKGEKDTETTASLADVSVGTMIAVDGTVTDTTIAATKIMIIPKTPISEEKKEEARENVVKKFFGKLKFW